MFKIQDSISDLSKNLINQKPDTSTVSILADKLVDTTMKSKTPETAVMELISNMCSNPSQLENLINLSKKIPTSK
ncbi:MULTISPECIES: hypothetical protein [Clostridium]|uniref:Nucleoside 2-deoxyribosyltransferase n=1 Tax=Clostridium carnis TaxID=1530 RepID=A0ABY6SRI2_9CLOT|nr:hypothetical protein [Clostridium carnis]CAI3560782.1 Nucleoside 2-deoxyribosyltransferase [Clostridium neonatale]CAI3562125.1 Nucleoside 2-deoxyribosyltransferase [Clostridium neonatale]CAI3583062.1 Nucleoside 2-deoxyribosyltransferase [Clostridium neonatale]CAI3622824.1 Nucleoside 2-deoxyribosyltransferase [Clostridium neonatale]CAI3675278.1 Nucleoside 2-deoxyribosyltransferase [Clostridium neonatale]